MVKKAILFLTIFFFLFCSDLLAVTSTPRPTSTLRPTSTPRSTSTPRPTNTPRPTSTPKSTSTPKPTSTPKNTPTTAPPANIDLKVEPVDLKFTGINLKSGDKTTLKATIHNLGNSKASKIKVQFFADNIKIYEKVIASISKNSKSTISYSYTIPDNITSDFSFTILIDPDHTLTETSQDNNTSSTTVPVKPSQKNLLIESFTASTANPKPGQSISFKIKVKNIGNAKASNINLALFADMASTTPTTTTTISSLNPNTSITKSISWKIPVIVNNSQNLLIRAVVDPDDFIKETDESDNYAGKTISLIVPDITIVAGEYFTAKGNGYTGTFSQMPVVVKNDNITALTGVKIGLYYSLNSPSAVRTKIVDTTLNLAKKASVTHMFDRVYIPASATIGNIVYYFIVVDPDNTISEFNETNNELIAERTVVVRPPQVQYPYLNIRVYDEAGLSLNNAAVTLTYSGQTKSKTTGSDVLLNNLAGSVVFDALPNSGQFTVSVSASGFRTLTETFAYDKNQDDSMYRTFTLDQKSALSGVVKNQSGQPLSFVTVKVEGTSLETTTDSQGKYGFILNGGSYTFRFVKAGYARIVESDKSVPVLSTITLDKTMSPTTSVYVSGRVTDDEGNGLGNVDIYINGNIIAFTANDGHFAFNNMSAGSKTFKFKKPGYVDTEFSETVEAGNEYNLTFVMFKPSTDTHVERGTEIVSWHQHEGTPGNAFWIPEYNVDVWWGLGRTKMALDFTKTGDTAKLTKLVINNHGKEWECNKVEGEGDIETSAIDIPITISAGSCTGKKTQMDVYKVAIESDGQEVWSDSSFWTSASDPMNTGTKVITLNNLQVNWNSNFKIKMWLRVQKRAVVGTDGDGAGALVSYHLDKKLVTWYPQKPPTTVITTSWGQIGGYLLGILDNPVTAVTNFSDLYSVERFNTYTMSEVLPADFPGSPPQN